MNNVGRLFIKTGSTIELPEYFTVIFVETSKYCTVFGEDLDAIYVSYPKEYLKDALEFCRNNKKLVDFNLLFE